jgi:hypothetical protein
MPPLAKPTLPTITQGSPFNITNTVSAKDKETPFNTTSSFSSTVEGYAESQTEKENQQETSADANVFQSEHYLAEWIQASNNGVIHFFETGLTVITFILFLL